MGRCAKYLNVYSYTGMAKLCLSGVCMGTQLIQASAIDDQRRWFAVYTRSHHEKRVAQYYTEREIEHLLPISRVERQWSHYRKVTIEMPLFPNYIFVHISRRERTRAI